MQKLNSALLPTTARCAAIFKGLREDLAAPRLPKPLLHDEAHRYAFRLVGKLAERNPEHYMLSAQGTDEAGYSWTIYETAAARPQ